MQPHFKYGRLEIAKPKDANKKGNIYTDLNYFDRWIYPDVFGDLTDPAQFLLDIVQAQAFLKNTTYELDEFFVSTIPEPLKLSTQIKNGKYVTPTGQFNQQTVDVIFHLKNSENN